MNLTFIGLWQTLLQYQSTDAFYLRLSRTDFLAIGLNTLLAGSLLGLAARALTRCQGRAGLLVRDALTLALLVPLLNILRQALRLTPDDAGRWLGALPTWSLAVAALVGLVTLTMLCALRPGLVGRSGGQLMLLASPFLLLNLGRLVWIIGTADLEQFRDRSLATAPANSANPAPRPRVLVVVFDEMDYRLTLGSGRVPRALPELEALERTSISASDARAPAGNTNESMPGLLIGEAVQALVPSGIRTGSLRLAGGQEADLDSLSTMFARAQALGVTSGLVGWNIPYCRTGLAAGLSRCHWWPSGLHLGTEEPLGATMLHQWVSVAPWNSRAIHQLRHAQIQREALTLVGDSTLGLVVLHLLVPHYPWIYDEAHEEFTLKSFGPRGYRGNLKLADRDLGTIRATLTRSGLEPRTILIVTSDHAWRSSAELDGQSDARVPWLVHWPGATDAVTISAPVQTAHTGDLALAILAGQVRSAESAYVWLSARSEVAP